MNTFNKSTPLSPWFSLANQPPVREGVYQIEDSFDKALTRYSLYKNKVWHVPGRTPAEAISNKNISSFIPAYKPDLTWRGVLKA